MTKDKEITCHCEDGWIYLHEDPEEPYYSRPYPCDICDQGKLLKEKEKLTNG